MCCTQKRGGSGSNTHTHTEKGKDQEALLCVREGWDSRELTDQWRVDAAEEEEEREELGEGAAPA